ncbi:DUF3562 domain-containing protein [Noviherbaspirillum pedocola]|uniref:DUF3562 domain-containing protein n=1 Tax=Noviherbaspirillum pedocola TaxID=2801341 RepID=A0A934SZU3_9BURK|nr:DUF3562 domain-containing protein [Noviherbaspirillum pedocola]MBK4738772.1 DUF3562 domain-containing protein [Noviherbaspirillum pedocola]
MEIEVVNDVRKLTVHHADAFRDDADRKRHLVAIAELAEEMRLPVEQVCSCYEAVLTEMRKEARIEDFLDIFVARRVREQLRIRAH